MSLEAQLSTDLWRSSLSLVAVLLIPFVCHVHLLPYSWFGRIPSAVANRYRKFTSLLKCYVSMTSITQPIELVNIAFQSVPLIHAEWEILGDDVCAASRRLTFFYWNSATGPTYSNDMVILRPNMEINCYDNFMRHVSWSTWNAQVIAQLRDWFRCLPSPAITANQKKWRIAGAGRCREK